MILLDTGPLVALLNAGDKHHGRCTKWYETAPAPLLVPAPVITEVGYFVQREHTKRQRLPASHAAQLVAGFLGSFGPTGPFTVVSPDSVILDRAGELVVRYADLPLDTVDAILIATAEQLNVQTIATLDHADFRVVRPRHVGAFTLVPA